MTLPKQAVTTPLVKTAFLFGCGMALYSLASNLATAAEPSPTPTDSTVVVIATRVQQSAFDLPVSVNSVSKDQLAADHPLINLSEVLGQVPGIVAQNRQNFAQDLQISARGFGARSTFGVRGVRLYSDGIPGTMPDGQGQLSHFDLASAGRIEVLRGPYSALYGNSSGGVIAVYTEDGKPGTALDLNAGYGSFDTRHETVKVSGAQEGINYVLDAGDLRTDGYRDHSAAHRVNANAKLRFDLPNNAQLTVVLNSVEMPEAQDALGLTRSQYQANPKQAGSGALQFDTRKTLQQNQAGLVYRDDLAENQTLNAMVYRGQRATRQYQSIPVSSQINPASSGGVIDLGRDYWGSDVNWTYRDSTASVPVQVTVGMSFDDLEEARKGYQNFIGSELGVRGALRRDEHNSVFDFDQYLQVQWELGSSWLLDAGVRNSEIRLRSMDHYIVPGNPDDSGSQSYRATTPVLGATFKATEALHFYLAYGKGFETPTLNELAYSSTNGSTTGLNLGLHPSHSEHYEAGLKATLAGSVKFNAAVFHVDTQDELAVEANSNGRSVYQNVGRTRRDGFEASLENNWDNGVGVVLAYTLLRAIYADSFSSCPGLPCVAQIIPSGNRLPGVPSSSLYGELSWRYAPLGFNTALEARDQSRVYANDANSDGAARYAVVNARAGFEQKLDAWQFKEFVRVDNLFDRQYIGSVIVNESNSRFFEPAPGRNSYIGLSANLHW